MVHYKPMNTQTQLRNPAGLSISADGARHQPVRLRCASSKATEARKASRRKAWQCYSQKEDVKARRAEYFYNYYAMKELLKPILAAKQPKVTTGLTRLATELKH